MNGYRGSFQTVEWAGSGSEEVKNEKDCTGLNLLIHAFI
jgi:hypothetical protein